MGQNLGWGSQESRTEARSARLGAKRGCAGGKEVAEKDRIPPSSSSSDVAC